MAEKILTFLNAPQAKISDIPNQSRAFLGISSEKGGTYRTGTRLGPTRLRETSLMYYYPGFEGLYDPEEERYILETKPLIDLGDIIPTGNFHEQIRRTVQAIVENHAFPVIMGGDHSITYPILQAFNQPFDVVHLDAHSDYQRFDEEGATECGLVMRRVKHLPYVNKIIHVGVRGFLNSGQGIRDSINDGNILITADKLRRHGYEEILKNTGTLPIYLSFDSDFLDPSICPGTTVPEPGGIDYLLAKDILVNLSRQREIIGADFVEYNPLYDYNLIGSLHLVKLILDLSGESN